MANMGDTGNGATFTLGTQTAVFSVKSIQIGEITIEMLDVSLLGSTDYMLEVASDLKSAPEVTINCIHNTSTVVPIVGAAAETGTVTFPQRTGEAAAATLAGTGVVTSLKLPDLENGTIQEMSFTFKFDGDTGPTYTKATTS